MKLVSQKDAENLGRYIVKSILPFTIVQRFEKQLLGQLLKTNRKTFTKKRLKTSYLHSCRLTVAPKGHSQGRIILRFISFQ